MQIQMDGAGPDLVLIHSLLTDARAYDVVTPVLAENHRVVRLSLPGYGGSSPLAEEATSVLDLADLVVEALDESEVSTDAAVLGNGLSAFVVVALAIEHGKRFEHLLVANGGSGFPVERRDAFTTMSDLVTEGGMEAVVDVAVRRIFTDAHLEAHPEVIDERRQVLLSIDPRSFAAYCRALRDTDMSQQIGAIANPTLVVAGGSDQTTPPEMARELADAVPGARYLEIAGCGHCPQLERPRALIEAIESFLKST